MRTYAAHASWMPLRTEAGAAATAGSAAANSARARATRPGFTLDEPKERLGHEIKLPPWYEPKRAEIVAALPPLT